MSVYEFTDYKAFIKARVQENTLIKAYQSKLAIAIGCQKSFLSQVLNSHVHLSLDHAAALCEFFSLTEDESAFLIDLVLLARSGSRQLQTFLKGRIKKAKQKRADPSERFIWPALSQTAGADVYYGSWYWAAIHIIVSIEKFNSASLIAEKLSLPLTTVESALRWLEEHKLIKKKTKGWQVTENQVYLQNTSPLTQSNHLMWRQKAGANIQSEDRAALHYSAIFALSESDFHKVKELIVEHVERLNQVILPSNSEELTCFTCDFFKL